MKLFLGFLTFLTIGLAADGAQRPNFVIINIDDLGYADIGPFGSKLNRTPNLDRMAAEGRKLTCHYAAPVCSPSRAALLTGCYPKRVLPIPHVLFPASAVGLNPDEQTIAELLKQSGYATACIGKWHLGDQPEFLPTRQGFDYYFGLPYSNDMGTDEDGAKSNYGEPLPQKKIAEIKSTETGITMGQPPLPLLENEKVIERVRQAEQATLTKRYTQKAQQFIRDQKDKPFFLYIPHAAVHFPLYPAPEFIGKSRNGLLGDWIEEVDQNVGQILDMLRELKLEQNTLVIFTSDNGGSIAYGSSNAPLRGSKGHTWEGGMRVPTIAWWPGKIPAGTATNEVTSMMDILPTLVKFAGGKLPDRKIDGGDIGPLLLGTPDAKSPRDHFFYYTGLKLAAIRSGPWKLHPDRSELYNLDSDIGEKKNVAAANPEVVERLKTLTESVKSDLGTDDIGPGCRPLGRVTNPQPLIRAGHAL